MIRFKENYLITAIILLFLSFCCLSGCSSAKKKQPTEGDIEKVFSPPETDATDAADKEPEIPPESDKQKPDVEVRKEPSVEARPRPWQIKLQHGSRRAIVDGVTVWLCEPAEQDGKRRVKATAKDQRASLNPLLKASGEPFITGRPLRILLDPGHGGEDPGAVSSDGFHRESKYVLDIARRLSIYLTGAGFEVYQTRSDDNTTLSLDERVKLAGSWKADLLVSIHLNSAPGSAAAGLETYALAPTGMPSTYQADQPKLSPGAKARIKAANPGNKFDSDNMRLAFCIQRRLLKATGRSDRGIRRARFTVLREARIPAVLVEAGFISNKREVEFLSTVNGRERIARGIYQGLQDFANGRIEPGYPPYPIVQSEQKKEAVIQPTWTNPPPYVIAGVTNRRVNLIAVTNSPGRLPGALNLPVRIPPATNAGIRLPRRQYLRNGKVRSYKGL